MRGVEERSEVQWGTTRIPYGIRRSTRRRTVALSVAPPGQIILTAPRDTPVERLDAVVHAKAKWIASRLRLVRPAEPRPSPREFVGGETFLYLGRQYRLEVRRGGAAPQSGLSAAGCGWGSPAHSPGKHERERCGRPSPDGTGSTPGSV